MASTIYFTLYITATAHPTYIRCSIDCFVHSISVCDSIHELSYGFRMPLFVCYAFVSHFSIVFLYPRESSTCFILSYYPAHHNLSFLPYLPFSRVLPSCFLLSFFLLFRFLRGFGLLEAPLRTGRREAHARTPLVFCLSRTGRDGYALLHLRTLLRGWGSSTRLPLYSISRMFLAISSRRRGCAAMG